MTPSFWAERRVLLTGHTGFKGAWAAMLLAERGAEVAGVSLAPKTDPNLWLLIKDRVPIMEEIVDLRDAGAIATICQSIQPQIVLHMAAQAQVRRSYQDPVGTFGSNVMGTVNLLEALRSTSGLEAILVVTSDKVYANSEDESTFTEESALGGTDPYSASKAAVELVTKVYADIFFSPRGVPLATARGGNVVGGGDFSSDRLVPDLYRAARAGDAVKLRYPRAYRPWQHVLDCLAGYLAYLEYLSDRGVAVPPALNFGPSSSEVLTVAEVSNAIGRRLGNRQAWQQAVGSFPTEKQALRLDSALARQTLHWQPRLDLAATIDWTAEWYAGYAGGEDALDLMRSQIARYFA